MTLCRAFSWEFLGKGQNCHSNPFHLCLDALCPQMGTGTQANGHHPKRPAAVHLYEAREATSEVPVNRRAQS